MREPWTPRGNDGIQLTEWQPGPLHLDTAGSPMCPDHGGDLELLYESDLPEGFDLVDGTEVWGCPRCYPSADGIDAIALAESIVAEWDEYADHFQNATPPDVPPGDGFVIG